MRGLRIAAVGTFPPTARLTPQAVVDELLAADRRFSAASAQTDLVDGLSAMFAPDVAMPVPGNGFAVGTAEVVAALRANPENATSRAEWMPVRGGVSADGLQGYTWGYMTCASPTARPCRSSTSRTG